MHGCDERVWIIRQCDTPHAVYNAGLRMTGDRLKTVNSFGGEIVRIHNHNTKRSYVTENRDGKTTRRRYIETYNNAFKYQEDLLQAPPNSKFSAQSDSCLPPYHQHPTTSLSIHQFQQLISNSTSHYRPPFAVRSGDSHSQHHYHNTSPCHHPYHDHASSTQKSAIQNSRPSHCSLISQKTSGS